ncbi:DUF3466 family protein [uncultured Vibrio sp.]|uniref:DUF3466 family protein n=1 Tax=uncultured Vibrio sp. TaxID=114054 RepID=UPI000A635E32|nr:DUF3466 family protein [uncultured Vibrio sp.]
MTSSKVFKLSSIAATVLAATTANAALYTIEEVSVPTHISNVTSYNEVYGVAIKPSTVGGSMGCFGTSCIGSDFELAAETRVTVDGVSYREESPFAMDRSFSYIQDYDDFKFYCYRELLYATCDSWAEEHWSAWNNELNNGTQNALAFVEGNITAYTNEYNNIINSLTDSADPVGNQSVAGGTRNKAVSPVLPIETGSDWKQSRAWKATTTSAYTVGSVARTYSNDQGTHHVSKAAIWDNTGAVTEIPWENSNTPKDGELLAQGSMRDIVVDGTDIFSVGYNTFSDDNYYDASVFIYTVADGWKTRRISGAESRIGGDTIHSNSVATGMNENLLVIGTAKRSGDYPENGAAGNRIFVADASNSTPSATFLSGGIFFSGAGGKAGAVNNYNEIVGQIDAEDTRENNGKPRRLRGFIYPYSFTNTDSDRRAIFENKAQYLDNLTNDDIVTGNANQYRIIDATDINDAGVISATAIKCSGGYDNTTHNSYCGGGSQTEETVAVKLVPIAGATSSNIQPRGIEEPVVERQGGSIGWAMFTLFGLLGLRRK